MSNRKSLLVGSIPAADTEEAVTAALDNLGPTLIAVPDGETGERKAWVASIIDRLSTNSDFELKKPGRWTSYEDIPRYRVRGARIDPTSLQLGYHATYLQNRSVIEQAAASRKIAAPPFQVGLASGFDLSLFSLGLCGALRHRAAFTEATAREIAAITNSARHVHDEVIFQIEIPAELAMVARAPAALRPLVARWMGRLATEIATVSAPGTRFGMHLCYGDLGNHSIVTGLCDCGASVALTNAIAASWPTNVILDYIHVPLAAGDEPPQELAVYYRPLQKLQLPAGTRFVAGFVHEALSDRQLQSVLGMIESARGGEVDIAAACGLGRRDPQVARTIMRESRVLCELPTRA
jgi:hypothetical protein